MGMEILTAKYIYRFGILLNKGISLLKDKGIEIGEIWVTLMYIYYHLIGASIEMFTPLQL